MIHPGRYTAAIDEPVVVFLIGMRFNNLLDVRAWWPVVTAMPKMLAELQAQREKGLLHAYAAAYWPGIMTVQYWRSFEDLERFARDPNDLHLPAWRAFNRVAYDRPSVGIFHETYVIEPGRTESVYGNMPRFGLGVAANHLTVSAGREAAKERLRNNAAR